ncbi:MAG TPA: hypothetical protein VKD08_05905 [Ignavibacteriaceae bacterium]|jgi:hypothetical protein|nr:hypothetical protein [Ignavibacteriaceae bacterium]
MATNIHLRALDESFEIAEKIKPARVDLSTVHIDESYSRKGLLKLSLSITYFFVLAYFLVKLLS